MSSNNNFGFLGPVPDGISVAGNIQRAQEYQATHSPEETAQWFKESVRNNKDGHLSPELSMDYKQIDPQFADFGNFNYGVIGKALGFPDWVLKNAAGWAQGKADELNNTESIIRMALDPANHGDHPEDQYQIWKGIKAADDAVYRGQTTVFGEFLLSAGMQSNAEVLLGMRTVVEYLLSPVRKAWHEAGRER